MVECPASTRPSVQSPRTTKRKKYPNVSIQKLTFKQCQKNVGLLHILFPHSMRPEKMFLSLLLYFHYALRTKNSNTFLKQDFIQSFLKNTC
jgi:hypothetical protein